MITPTQSDPAYKKRLISAMLETPVLDEVSDTVWDPPRTWSIKVISMVVGLAFFSGLAVFLFLYHHDASTRSFSGTIPVIASRLEAQTKNESITQDQASSVHKTVEPATAPIDNGISAPEPVDFKIKRSRAYQTVGGIGLRLLRVNPRRRTCDVSIQFTNRRSLQKRFQLNRPLQVKPTPSADPFEITVSAMSRDGITGSLSGALPGFLSASEQ